jgi:hypothetical protein
MSFADSEKFTINYWSKPEYSISKKIFIKNEKNANSFVNYFYNQWIIPGTFIFYFAESKISFLDWPYLFLVH